MTETMTWKFFRERMIVEMVFVLTTNVESLFGWHLEDLFAIINDKKKKEKKFFVSICVCMYWLIQTNMVLILNDHKCCWWGKLICKSFHPTKLRWFGGLWIWSRPITIVEYRLRGFHMLFCGCDMALGVKLNNEDHVEKKPMELLFLSLYTWFCGQKVFDYVPIPFKAFAKT